MKVVVRCVNCNRIVRRSNCYRVRLLGKASETQTNRGLTTSSERLVWRDVEEKVWLCKPCAKMAGYKVKGAKEYVEENKEFIN